MRESDLMTLGVTTAARFQNPQAVRHLREGFYRRGLQWGNKKSQHRSGPSGRGCCAHYAPNYFCMLRAEPIAVNDVPDGAMTLPGVPSFRNAGRTGPGITARI